MSVRNILDQLGEVDFTYDYTRNVSFGTMTLSVTFRRSNKLCVIALNAGTVATINYESEFVSQSGFVLPTEMTPTSQSVVAPAFVNNGVDSQGCVYLDGTPSHLIHIAGGPYPGTTFHVGTSNGGIPYGAILVYTV